MGLKVGSGFIWRNLIFKLVFYRMFGGIFSPETVVQAKEAGISRTSTSKSKARIMNAAKTRALRDPSITAYLLCPASEETHFSL